MTSTSVTGQSPRCRLKLSGRFRLSDAPPLGSILCPSSSAENLLMRNRRIVNSGMICRPRCRHGRDLRRELGSPDPDFHPVFAPIFDFAVNDILEWLERFPVT
jgi:hypothetical protein